MKKTLKKVFLTCAVIGALSAAMSVSAMAAISDASVSSSYADGAASVTYSGKATANEQVTALVIKADAITETDTEISADEILYIDQMQADSEGAFSFVMPLGSQTEGTQVTVMGGGESVEADGITKQTVTLDDGGDDPDPEYTLGDVNDDTLIDVTDAAYVLYFDAGTRTPTDVEKLAADVTGDTIIDVTDAAWILYVDATLKTADEFPAVK